MRMPLLFVAVTMMIGTGSTGWGEDSPATRLSLKGLGGVAVRVTPIHADAHRDGLSAETIGTGTVAQIRKAGIRVLTTEQQRRLPQRPCLQVKISTAKLDTGEHVYAVRLELIQWVASLADPNATVSQAVPVPAVTWSPPGALGIAPGAQLPAQVRAAVTTMVDEFVAAYHKANPSATAYQPRANGALR